MEAGLTDTFHDMHFIVDLIDKDYRCKKPGPAVGTKYKKRHTKA